MNITFTKVVLEKSDDDAAPPLVYARLLTNIESTIIASDCSIAATPPPVMAELLKNVQYWNLPNHHHHHHQQQQQQHKIACRHWLESEFGVRRMAVTRESGRSSNVGVVALEGAVDERCTNQLCLANVKNGTARIESIVLADGDDGGDERNTVVDCK